MPSSSTHELRDSMLAFLEVERQSFWQAHLNWSEGQRRAAWSQQTAELASQLGRNSTSTGLKGTGAEDSSVRLAQIEEQAHSAFDARQRTRQRPDDVAPVSMTRKPVSMDPRRSATSSMQQDSGKRTHQLMEKSYSAPNGNHSTYWTGAPTQQQPDQFVSYNPAEFVTTKLAPTSDDSYVNAKRQKVEGRNGSDRCPSFQVADLYNVSPSTSFSSSLSPPSLLTSSDAMSRQCSTTSTSSMVDGIDMMRLASSSSNCSESMPFPIDDLGASFLSCATEKPRNDGDVTGMYQGAAPQWPSYMGNEYSHEFSFNESSYLGGMIDGQGLDQSSTWPGYPNHDMQRSISDQSASGISSGGSKANERRRKHVENGSRPIASKCFPDGPISLKLDSKIRILRPQEPGTQRKEAIAKAPYLRPQHPKLKCDLCSEYPDGFRGEHELRRHHERAHAHLRRVWICVDPNIATKEGWRPSRPLGICKQCNQQKEYNVYYNAAAHLRRAHFCPRKRGRKAKGEERESRAGKAGGDWPPIDWLKNNGWLKEIEVNAKEVSASLVMPSEEIAADTLKLEDDTFDDEVDYDYDAGLDAFHDSISADMLGMSQPMMADFAFGYPTPALDPVMPWSTNNYQSCLPRAPLMEHTLSAPPALSGSMMYSYNSSSF